MPIPAATETRSARIERLRIAVPRHDGRFCLHLADGERVHGRAEAADGGGASLAGLDALARRGAEASLGVYRLDDGSAWLHWAIGDDGQGLVPARIDAVRAHAARGLRRWLPALLAALATTALALWRLMDGLGWALLLPFALIAVLLAAIATLGHAATLHRARRDRRVVVASETALADALRQRPRAPQQPRAGAETETAAAPLTPPAHAARARDPSAPAQPGHPPLRRWQGTLAGLEMREERRGSGDARRDFGVYRFRLGAQAFALRASRALGAHEPFLAEGDRVELIAHGDAADDGEAMVYALHSLEDGRRYVAHAQFSGDGHAAAMVRLSWTGLRRLLRLIAASAAGALALQGGICLWAGGDDSLAILSIACACALALLALPTLCFAVSRWRWRRRGAPGGRRQATTQRVYAAMDLGPPWAWRLPADAVEV